MHAVRPSPLNPAMSRDFPSSEANGIPTDTAGFGSSAEARLLST
jgi:hypothetical protein